MYAVIPAAGFGSRMGELSRSKSKVLLQLGAETSVLQQTLKAVAASGCCLGIVILTREAERSEILNVLQDAAPDLDCIVGVGGETRQDSVYAGLKLIEKKAEFAFIHDAARPLCSPEEMRAVAAAARHSGAAILACPVKPTIKDVGSSGFVERTIPRSTLWEAQTPQVFRYSLIRQAHDAAREERYVGTDDSELVERLGFPVTVVPGSERNIKITTPVDLKLADLLSAD